MKRTVKQAKRSKETNIATICKSNPKCFYSYINERRIVRDKVGPPKTPDGIVVTTDNDMANTLNDYFSSVFTQEQLNNIPQLDQYEGNAIDIFNFRVNEVQEKLQHLNIYKSTGPDLLHPIILRTLEDSLSATIIYIFNSSAETGIIPVDWKSANVTAIHKKGSRQEPGNYRPISLTSVVCKTMERLVKERLIAHLEGNNLIGDSRHRFRNKRSCLTSLLDFFAQVIDTYDSDNNKAVDFLVYLDFQKVFVLTRYHMRESWQRSMHMASKVMQPDRSGTG